MYCSLSIRIAVYPAAHDQSQQVGSQASRRGRRPAGRYPRAGPGRLEGNAARSRAVCEGPTSLVRARNSARGMTPMTRSTRLCDDAMIDSTWLPVAIATACRHAVVDPNTSAQGDRS